MLLTGETHKATQTDLKIKRFLKRYPEKQQFTKTKQNRHTCVNKTQGKMY